MASFKIRIEEDPEMREYIKELIKSQVISVSREEIAAAVLETLTRKLDFIANDRASIFSLLEKLTKSIITEMADKQIETQICFIHDKALDAFNKRINDRLENFLTDERLEELITERVNSIVDTRVLFLKPKTKEKK